MNNLFDRFELTYGIVIVSWIRYRYFMLVRARRESYDPIELMINVGKV